ncbi:hypothetical protein HHI36_003352 [Cryptolaemus montrouzieri]|uniref:Uncharacterized protein n=1 Tax=Cryptolaemus montrouzieri TaxID=559131 RepID=A0ABD2PD69_9CUCU
MEIGDVFALQAKLEVHRRIFPNLIARTYEKTRLAKLKYLLNLNFEINNLPDIPFELLQNCQQYERIGDEFLDEYLEQIRIMIILAEKKHCKLSNVIDAI